MYNAPHFYIFGDLKLVVEIHYIPEGNVIEYILSRPISPDEKLIVEGEILTIFAFTTNYHSQYPSALVCDGVSLKVLSNYKNFMANMKKESEIKAETAVKDLLETVFKKH